MGKEFEDNKGVIRISKSKDRQHNGAKKKDKQQSTKYSTENWRSITTNPTHNWGEVMCSGRVGSSCSTSGIRRVIKLHVLE